MLENRVYDPSKASVFIAGKEVKEYAEIKFTYYPISFICGREMIEAFGIHEPKKGCVIYLLHQSEIGDGKWMPEFIVKEYRLHAFCLPDEVLFKDCIKKLLDNIQDTDNELSYDFKTINLKGIEQSKG